MKLGSQRALDILWPKERVKGHHINNRLGHICTLIHLVSHWGLHVWGSSHTLEEIYTLFIVYKKIIKKKNL